MLLDCGWDDAYDVELLKPLKDVLDRVDCVLLSHPTPDHLGALPYLVPHRHPLHTPLRTILMPYPYSHAWSHEEGNPSMHASSRH